MRHHLHLRAERPTADESPSLRATTAQGAAAGRAAGFDCILLDTLDDMEAARALYQELGFVDIPPYYYNPIAGAHYLKADLAASGTRW